MVSDRRAALRALAGRSPRSQRLVTDPWPWVSTVGVSCGPEVAFLRATSRPSTRLVSSRSRFWSAATSFGRTSPGRPPQTRSREPAVRRVVRPSSHTVPLLVVGSRPCRHEACSRPSAQGPADEASRPGLAPMMGVRRGPSQGPSAPGSNRHGGLRVVGVSGTGTSGETRCTGASRGRDLRLHRRRAVQTWSSRTAHRRRAAAGEGRPGRVSREVLDPASE